MEKEFLPYEQSLKLKELGFNEPCFGFYTEEYKGLCKNFCKYPINLPTKPFLAPTFSQAFRFFREKYGLFCWIEKLHTLNEYIFRIMLSIVEGYYSTYEEAELACVDKLIKLVEKKS